MSRSLSRPQAILLGILVMAALLLGASALLFLNERAGWGNGSFHVQAGFPDINGVEVGTRVRIQGMDAGEVEAIVIPDDPGATVKLRLRIAGKYRHLVGADAKVQIASENLLASKVVRVVPGSAQAKRIDDDGELQADVQPDLLDDLARAAKKLDGVVTRADALLDGLEKGEGTLGKLAKDESLYNEVTDTLQQVKIAIKEVRGGDGTLGKLVKTNEAYSEAMASLHDVRRMVNSVKQNSDAIKALPVVRNYVVDPNKELIRPDCKRYRRWYAEKDLFEPGKAVLTGPGKKLLDDAAVWLNEQKGEGAELVVASFADPGQQADFAHTVTQKQSEVISEYLRSQHRVHRTGWWWWSTRTVKTIGCGTLPSPVPENEQLPSARIELIVFVPQG